MRKHFFLLLLIGISFLLALKLNNAIIVDVQSMSDYECRFWDSGSSFADVRNAITADYSFVCASGTIKVQYYAGTYYISRNSLYFNTTFLSSETTINDVYLFIDIAGGSEDQINDGYDYVGWTRFYPDDIWNPSADDYNNLILTDTPVYSEKIDLGGIVAEGTNATWKINQSVIAKENYTLLFGLEGHDMSNNAISASNAENMLRMYGGEFVTFLRINYSSSVVMILDTNLNNTVNYNLPELNYTINATFYDSTTTLANCSIFENDIERETTEFDLSNNIHLNISFASTGLYNLSINCSNFENSDSIGYYYFRVDLEAPVILSDFHSGTVFNVTDIFRFYVNASDTNLYAVNISFFNTLGDSYIMGNVFSDNITTGFYDYIKSVELTNDYLVGNATIRIQAWDSHTGYKLKYKPKIEDNKLIYGDIIFYCDDLKSIKIKEYKDKVSANIKFNKKADNHTCYYEGTNDFTFVDDKYKNHYVSLSKGIWIDEILESAIITPIDKKLVLRISEDTDSFTSNSIGDLNYNVEYYYFTVQTLSTSSDVYLPILHNDLETIGEGINMLWFWGLFILAVIIPFAVKKEDRFTGNIVSTIIFVVLLYINQVLNFFDLANRFQTMITLILFLFMLAYTFIISDYFK